MATDSAGRCTMPIQPSRPKYAEIVDAIERRIERQVYRVGDMLPSEAQLVREFGASRSTVVRALEYLRQQGWIRGLQGKGRVVVRGAFADAQPAPERVRRLLHPAAFADVEVLSVLTMASAPSRTAIDGPVIVRQELVNLAGP